MPTYSKIHISIAAVKTSIAEIVAAGRALWGAVLLTLGLAISAAADTQLLMFEEAGCVYCVQWHAEISPEYPITPEGRAAPLVRLDLRDTLPETYALASRPRYTPTFILVQDGIEIGRIEGYPGEHFFWGLLGRLLNQAEPHS